QQQQQQQQQPLINVGVTNSPAQMEVDVESVHQQAAVAIQEVSKNQSAMSYPGPQIQPAPGPMALASGPSRTMTYPIGSQQPATEKPYGCNQCDMRFRRLHDLKRHSKLHTGEKPHVCPKCERKFARGDALARHSKGVGGCAARRTSMNTYVDTDALDGHPLLDTDSASMVYGQAPENGSAGQPEARFQSDGHFHDHRVTLQLQSANGTARDGTVTGATGAGAGTVYNLASSPKDLATTVRTADVRHDGTSAEDKSRLATTGVEAADASLGGATATTANTAAGSATGTASTTTATSAGATAATPAATTTTTTTTTTDPALNVFTSANAAVWTYIISLETRLATLEKSDREKSEQIAAMEKHISLIATQLSTPKQQ
ncbi:hypothetical protein TD95_005175, partial [Thielaviopsis punctulata]